jgi:hypothetical protein
MPIAQIVTLLFLLIALLMVAWTFFPTWTMPPVLSIPRILGLVAGLIILWIIYIIVVSILRGVAV